MGINKSSTLSRLIAAFKPLRRRSVIRNLFTVAKTCAAEAQAEKLETANAVPRRDLIPALEVEREWSAALRDVPEAELLPAAHVRVGNG